MQGRALERRGDAAKYEGGSVCSLLYQTGSRSAQRCTPHLSTPETMTHVHKCLYFATAGLITAAHYTRRIVASSVRLWRGVSGWCTFR